MGAAADAYVLHRDTPLGAALALVADELSEALGKFGSFASPHEGIAVIREEYLELEAEVFRKDAQASAMREEAVQLAAMATRFVLDLCDPLGRGPTVGFPE